ncbi:hypothetical protein I350_05500 [Cryptococcus amylolentus CBS 6273]|uniref:Zn(2)-C6 fungal-type domain-containing protein n=1 Tax=Cryptococcus amylolentus CBS 6273 TaxID=1296118 RepID=A0A1E3JVR5_9TREE|nr:hypothetical protein I350_05500 [Cryptococcus amylolentus CBS 6273]
MSSSLSFYSTPPAAAAPTTSKVIRKRSSKACEQCRTLRIKCGGNVPCAPCVASGLPDQCIIRLKARPRRQSNVKSARSILEQEPLMASPIAEFSSSGTGGDERSSRPSAVPGPSNTAASTSVEIYPSPSTSLNEGSVCSDSARHVKHNPLDIIETTLNGWCQDTGIPISSLTFKLESRIAPLKGPPLPGPSHIIAFEDSLIQQLLAIPKYDGFRAVDQSRLLSLYSRYRAIPHSLTEDQKAFMYAILCTGRLMQIRQRWSDATQGRDKDQAVSREDVTYFWLACNALKEWGRASIYAICSIRETQTLLEQMGWQIVHLGLHQKATASLYAPSEHVGPLMASFFYTDVFVSSLSDLKPYIPLRKVDVDPSHVYNLVPDCLSRASSFTAELLADFNDPAVDTSSFAYIATSETSWNEALRELRNEKTEAVSKCHDAWAEFRYCWLRILLHTPHIHHPLYSAQAYAAISRAITQILQVYGELIEAGQLNPSWPQIQRLVVCGQLVILCSRSGELRHLEIQDLFDRLVEALEKHGATWDTCLALAEGFRKAALSLGFEVKANEKQNAPIASSLDSGILGLFDSGAPFSGWSLDDFDPSMLFAFDYEPMESDAQQGGPPS